MIDDLIYSPSDGVTYAVEYLEKARANIKAGLGLRFPIEKIARDYPVPPLMPGKVLTFQGQSHNGKSMFLNFWKNNLAQRLEDNHRQEDIIISILAEDMVEEQMVSELLAAAEKHNMRGKLSDMDTVKIVAAKIATTPIYYIGSSIKRAKSDAPLPTMSNVARAIARIIEQRKDKGMNTVVQGVFADYIQAMPMDNEVIGMLPDKTRRLQVRQDFFGLRRLAAQIPAPCVMASQSKQALGGHLSDNMYLPGLYDHQETSAIPQHTDTDFSIWMPKTNLKYGTNVTHEGGHPISFTVRDDLAWMRCNKQRGFDPNTLRLLPAGMFWPLEIDFDNGTYSLADVEKLEIE